LFVNYFIIPLNLPNTRILEISDRYLEHNLIIRTAALMRAKIYYCFFNSYLILLLLFASECIIS